MKSMARRLAGIAVLLVLARAGVAAGQAPASGTVRAAGSPLRDGALPPGMLTVRVVRGAFANNLAGLEVTADLGGGQTQAARTGADGRAQFAHLPVGARVRVTTTADGEALRSETFDMPAESGVRVLLVAGGEAAGEGLVAHGTAPDVTPGPALPAAAGPAPAAAHAPVSPTPAGGLQKTLALCAAAGLAILWLLMRPRAPRA